MKQLMHVVEGLEEELFTSEARRNDAEVTWHPSHLAVEAAASHA